MGKSVDELCNSMSAHELCVIWPEYFATRNRIRQAEEEKRASR